MTYRNSSNVEKQGIPFNGKVAFVIIGALVVFLGFAALMNYLEENPEEAGVDETRNPGLSPSSNPYEGFEISSEGAVAYGKIEYKNVEDIYADAEGRWLLSVGEPSQNNGMQRYLSAMIIVPDLNSIPPVTIETPNDGVLWAGNFQVDNSGYMRTLSADQEGFNSIQVEVFSLRENSDPIIIGGESKWKSGEEIKLQDKGEGKYLIHLSKRVH